MRFNDITLLSILNDYKIFQYSEVMRLLQEFQSVEKIFDAQQKELEQFVSSSKVNKFIKFRDEFNFEPYYRMIRELSKKNVTILPFYHEKYPELLKTISNPPLVLFHKGSLLEFSNCIAVVGTRNLSHYGHKMARKLSQELAQAGYTIVSGLARGTDTEAHCGALDVGGRTIAVLANNITEIYPPENEKLSSDIIKSGAILSESTILKKLNKSNFVLRNRITSGLSKCVVVIESGNKRGTSHQVKIAHDQNKPIFLLKPIELNSTSANDFNEFIELGAIPFTSSNEILSQIQDNGEIFKKNLEVVKDAPVTCEEWTVIPSKSNPSNSFISNKSPKKILNSRLEDFIK